MEVDAHDIMPKKVTISRLKSLPTVRLDIDSILLFPFNQNYYAETDILPPLLYAIIPSTVSACFLEAILDLIWNPTVDSQGY